MQVQIRPLCLGAFPFSLAYAHRLENLACRCPRTVCLVDMKFPTLILHLLPRRSKTMADRVGLDWASFGPDVEKPYIMVMKGREEQFDAVERWAHTLTASNRLRKERSVQRSARDLEQRSRSRSATR